MVHLDTKRLPVLAVETPRDTHEYLFVAIDDFSRELYAAILPDKTQYSAETFLNQQLYECPYTIEQIYSDNGTEYRGTKDHAFMKLCSENKIEQRFTKVKTPRTNGKAERVIRTLMDMWHRKTHFKSRAHRKTELILIHKLVQYRSSRTKESMTAHPWNSLLIIFIHRNCKQRWII